MARACEQGGATKPNGNCTEPASDDGLPVQCVGFWAARKHDYLARYIGATWAARSKFLPPAGKGGAAYVDLFAGPGRARIRAGGEIVDGSPLIALAHDRAPFTKAVLCDSDDENVATLTKRTAAHAGRVSILAGDCNALIAKVVALVPPHGLNLAFVDPFGPKPLVWQTVAALASISRMDLVIHFPTGSIKRNLKHQGFEDTLTAFLGTDAWKAPGFQPRDVGRLVDCLHDQLVGLGYDRDRVRTLPVLNSSNTILYHLVFASKAPLGTKIWRSVASVDVSGQRSLF